MQSSWFLPLQLFSPLLPSSQSFTLFSYDGDMSLSIPLTHALKVVNSCSCSSAQRSPSSNDITPYLLSKYICSEFILVSALMPSTSSKRFFLSTSIHSFQLDTTAIPHIRVVIKLIKAPSGLSCLKASSNSCLCALYLFQQ